MPRIDEGTEWQRQAFQRIHAELGVRRKYLEKDDHYKLVNGTIFAYIKVLSQHTRGAGPPGGLKVIVKQELWSNLRDDLVDGNDWYGPSRHMFATEDSADSIDLALEILRTARRRPS